MDTAGVELSRIEAMGAGGLVCLVGVAWLLAPRWTRSAGRDFARQYGVQISPEFLGEFEREQVRRARLTMIISLPGLLLFLVTMGEHSFLAMAAPGLLALPVLAEMIRRVARAGSEFTAAPGRPGLARTRTPGVLDYLDRRVVVAHAAQAGIGLTAIGSALVTASRTGWAPDAAGAAVTGLLIAVVAVVGPVVWHLEVGRPQRATDAAHLYLQDAWRADAMRSASLLAGPGTLTALRLQDPSSSSSLALAAVQLVLLAASATCLLIDLDPETPRFRKRLWPTLAPGEVLVPGQSIAGRGAA
ncbi:hypothetical protein ACJ5H2_11125 [Nocardioides sp. R1-1]|uniref:hypothetical protein n=1 Tax=Nocardioides sp. R1-1 TaxID=3383502 RepID=UPI0038D10E52